MRRHDHAVQAGHVVAVEDREMVGVFSRFQHGSQRLRISPFSEIPYGAWTDYTWTLVAIVTPGGSASIILN